MCAAAELEFRLLGSLEVRAGEQVLPLGGHKQRALLAILLMRANEVVPAERLVDALWGERPPATAATALQVHMSELRKRLGADVIRTRSRGYVLSVDPDRVDVFRFERLLKSGRDSLATGDQERAVETLSEALSLWRGSPLADFTYEPFAHADAARLEEWRIEAIEERIEAELALGRHGELVGELAALVDQHPLRERLRGQLMLSLYRSGRQADALTAYHEARRLLLEELGLAPGPELRQLEAAILRQDPALEVEPIEVRARRHLPAQPNAFVGRERELAELVELLSSGGERLVTLTGTGGIGKTRLAVAVAERLAASFSDGVWFVDLAPLSDHTLVPSVVAQALRVQERPDEPVMATLVAHLRGRETLLLVDNVEHLLPAATILSDLLKEAPQLKLLVTSRAPLHLYGEHRYEVPPLGLPDLAHPADDRTFLECESCALFLARARAIGRQPPPDALDARLTAEICVRLDGLPLAIELAAARLDRFATAELHEGLGAALDLLTKGPRDVSHRQRTLRATLDWSYELLEPDEQELFSSLAVFAGGWTPAAAQSVCRADPRALDSLVEKSLVRLRETELGPRCWMLETVRAYAAEKLEQRGAAREVRQRLAEYLVAFTTPAAESFESSRSAEWLTLLEAEQENLRAALAFLEETEQTDLHLELIGSIWRYWYGRGLSLEGHRWAKSALARLDGRRTLGAASALAAASAFASSIGDLAEAEAHAEECLSIRCELGEPRSISEVLSGLGHIAALRGDLERAERMLEEAAALARRAGSSFQLAMAVGNLGDLVLLQGDIARASALTDEALTHFRELGSEWGCAWMLTNRAFCLLQAGRIEECLGAVRKTGELSYGGEDMRLVYCSALLIAAVALRRGQVDAAAELIGVADAICRLTGISPGPVDGGLHESTEEQLLGLLGPERYAAASAEARAMSLERATQSVFDAS